MKRAVIAGGAFVIVLVLLLFAAGHRAFEKDVVPHAATSPAMTPSLAAAAKDAHQGFLYGRVTPTLGAATYEGRLRWGGDQEAFWGDYFNGFKAENPWVAHAPPGRLPQERRPIEIFGVEIGYRKRRIDVGRFFMARFGDIARVEAHGRDVRVTLKSGTVFDLDRLEASDFDDGVRVWDVRRGVVDLTADIETEFLARIDGNRRIRTIELLPTARLGAAPNRCTVRCARGRTTSPASFSGTGTSAPATAKSARATAGSTSTTGVAPVDPSRLTEEIGKVKFDSIIAPALGAVLGLGIWIPDRQYVAYMRSRGHYAEYGMVTLVKEKTGVFRGEVRWTIFMSRVRPHRMVRYEKTRPLVHKYSSLRERRSCTPSSSLARPRVTESVV